MTGIIISSATILSLIVCGLLMRKKRFANSKRIYCVALAMSMLLVFLGVIIAFGSSCAFAAEVSQATANPSAGLGFLGAAIVTAASCIAAAYAVANVGTAAIGLVSENPDMLGATLIYLGLAEGIAIYGVIVSLMILQKF